MRLTLLVAATETNPGLRILLGLAVLVALSLAGTSRRALSLGRTSVGKMLITGGWVAVLVGLLLGPGGVGLIGDTHVMVLRPLVLFCLGWVGLMIGMQLRIDLLKMLPAHTWRAVATDGVFSAVVLGAVAFALLTYGMRSRIEELERVHLIAAAVGAAILAASGFGWSAETRSIVGNRPELQKAAGVLRAVSGLVSIFAVLAYGGVFMVIQHADGLSFSLVTLMIGLGVSLMIAVVCGIMGYWMMSLAGRGNSEFLVVLLGLVALFAGAAAMMGASALFVGMCVGAVVINIPGKTLVRFQRVILDAEHPIAMALMLTAGVLIDPRLAWWMWLMVLALVAARLLVKVSVSRRQIVRVEPSAKSTAVMIGPLRQAPLGVAMATGYAISIHADAANKIESVVSGNQLVTVVVLVGLLTELSPLVSRMVHPERWPGSKPKEAKAAAVEVGDEPTGEGME